VDARGAMGASRSTRQEHRLAASSTAVRSGIATAATGVARRL